MYTLYLSNQWLIFFLISSMALSTYPPTWLPTYLPNVLQAPPVWDGIGDFQGRYQNGVLDFGTKVQPLSPKRL